MPPADGSSLQKSRLMGPQLAHLWWPAGAKLQAASAMGQTDGRTDGRIALFQNALYDREHKNPSFRLASLT